MNGEERIYLSFFPMGIGAFSDEEYIDLAKDLAERAQININIFESKDRFTIILRTNSAIFDSESASMFGALQATATAIKSKYRIKIFWHSLYCLND